MDGTRTNNKTLLDKIRNQFKGYYVEYLNLSDFISHNNLDMILNNTIFNCETFELYNFEELYDSELSEVYDDLKYYIDSIFNDIDDIDDIDIILSKHGLTIDNIESFDDLLNILSRDDIDDLIESNMDQIDEYIIESIYSMEVYQFYIISEYDADNYWSKYTDYPIYYNDDLDIYLLGIGHYGMSWKFFNTSYGVRHYL